MFKTILTGVLAATLTAPGAVPAMPAPEPLHGYIYETDTTTGQPDGMPLYVIALCDGRQLYISQQNGLHLDQSVDVYPLGRVTPAPQGANYLPYIRDNNRVPCPTHAAE